ncbi:MAG TPA: Calx-beta domain-containing protein [Thermoanaerobaculia bacterium]|jgi:ELWxxDGT repeat protein|nr:Calx-beta domain-containing protein [Thermoanaerobaculia bacterium]
MPLRQLIATALLLFCAAAARPQTVTPFLLHDVNPTTEMQPQSLQFTTAPSAAPSGDDLFLMSVGPLSGLWHVGAGDSGNFFIGSADDSATVGNLTYFWNSITRATLRVTDGTTNGTHAVGEFPEVSEAAACGTKTCFAIGGNFLAVSDGTAGGTWVLTSTEPLVTDTNMPEYLASTGDTVYFKGFDLAHGQCVDFPEGTFCGELWRSDGTAAGTHIVADIIPGPFPAAPESLLAWNGKVYFVAFAPDLDPLYRYIYVSDGTAAGTQPLTRLETVKRSNFGKFVAAGRYVYFFTTQNQWWRTEGTPKTTMRVRDLAGLTGFALTDDLIASPNSVLFTVRRDYEVPTYELWSYDGTNAVKLGEVPLSINLLGYWPVTARFYYAEIENGDQEQILYETDGASPGRVVSRLPGIHYSLDFSAGVHAAHFSAYRGGNYDELWQTDGTANGTHRIHDETPVGVSSIPFSLTALPNRLYFYATNSRTQLYSSDGIGTATPVPQVTCNQSCPQLIVRDELVYLQQGSEWWTLDGGGTAARLSESFGIDQNPLTIPVRLADAQYLIASAETGANLWKRDASGSRVVTSFSPATPSAQLSLVSSKTRLFFSDGTTLWTSDGTAEGTHTIISGDVSSLTASDGGVFFRYAVNGIHELWFSDGTVPGTTHVIVATMPGEFLYYSFTAWHDMVFYIDPFTGHLWRTRAGQDGNLELPRSDDSGNLVYFVEHGGRLAIVWNNVDTDTCQVWSTDGSSQGTQLLYTVDHVMRVLPPLRMGNGDLVVPMQRNNGKRTFLNVRTGLQIDTSNVIAIPAFDGDGAIVGVGTRAIFAGVTPRTGREIWAVDLAGATRPTHPTASLVFTGITSLYGHRAAVFTITLSGDSLQTSSLQFETADGTLRSGHDYTATSGTLEFSPGQSVRSVVVPVSDASGTLSLVLTQPDNADIAAGFATATVPSPALRRHPSRP